jgi:hypothetical protein
LKGFIYKHTNKINGKVYIGQTTQDPLIRWGKEGINYKNQRAFYREIIRDGWDNFDHEIIEVAESKDKKVLKQLLDSLEIHYIKKYKSMSLDKGYNATYKDKGLSTRLSHISRRFINRQMKEGKTFEEAYELYRNKRKGG